MKRWIALVALLATAPAWAFSSIQGTSQFNVDASTLKALTVPPAALYARVCVRSGELETTTDVTTPTTAPKGSAFPAGTCTWLDGRSLMLSWQGIGLAGVKFDAEYFQ